MNDLTDLVGRASSLWERLSSGRDASAATNPASIDARVQRWRRVVAKGDAAIFRRRLDWAGLDDNKIESALGQVRRVNPLPDWARTLEAVMQTASALPAESAALCDRSFDAHAPMPFEHVFVPFLQTARRKLAALAPNTDALLSTKAQSDLERSLLERLSRVCTPSLALEFSIFRAAGRTYDDFVRHLLSDGLGAFLQEYAVLARLTASAIDYWVEAMAEFLQRLARDQAEIQLAFFGGAGWEQVTAIQSGLSDYHNRGRAVLALTFSSGRKLIYKPKDLGLEAALTQLVEWLNRHAITPPLRTAAVVNRAGYGWMEYIEHRPVADQAAARRYFTRAGMLLGVIYLLGGTDTHNENLIASGEYPILVDVEALLHPRARDMVEESDETDSLRALYRQLAESVLASGLLTEWNVSRNKRSVFDMSGLGNMSDPAVTFERTVWKNVNTDDMRQETETFLMPPQSNTLLIEGDAVSPVDYASELVEGFQQIYQLVLANRETLLRPDGPLAHLAGQPVRFIFRNTAIYAAIANRALSPKVMRDGVDRSIELDMLSRAFLITDSAPYNWPLLQAELDAMERMDIPLFTTQSDQADVMLESDALVWNAFKESSYERVRARVQQLCERDLAFQVALIRGSLYTQAARTNPAGLDTWPAPAQLEAERLAPLTRDEYIQHAERIGQSLAQRATRLSDGGVAWIGVSHDDQFDRFRLQPLSWDLYEGASGVALFLAALAHATGQSQYHDLAYAALQPLRRMVQRLDHPVTRKTFQQMQIGGAVGLGSLVYALACSGDFLRDGGLTDEAHHVAMQITDALVAADQAFDVIGGAAGALLGLTTLYRTRGDARVLDRAIACGEHLLKNRVTSPRGHRTWAAFDSLLTGFSHGAAGIAYSLLRLYSITGTRAWLEAAQEAIAYEQSVFSPDAGNWPDLRPPLPSSGEMRFTTSWCNGAPGITLARLGGLSVLDTAEVRQDIGLGLATTQNYSLTESDHLCCGNLGRVETLLTAAHKLGDPALERAAHQRAAWIVNRAAREETFGLSPRLPPEVSRVGFFQGLAGIGYELLRLADPQTMPCVLLWE